MSRRSDLDRGGERRRGGLRPEEIELLLAEVESRLVGSRIDKIFDGGPEAFVLRFDGNRDSRLDLLVSTYPGATRFHAVTDATAPAKPSESAVQLRRLLRRFKVIAVDQPGGDRILRLKFERGSDDEKQERSLVLELFGAAGRLVVFDTEDRIVHLSRGRAPVAPGKMYKFPPSPQKSQDLFAKLDPRSVIPFELRDDALAFHRTIEARSAKEIERLRLDARKRGALRAARGEVKKLRRLIAQLESDLERAERWPREQQLGELITAAMHDVKSGQTSLTTTDWYAGGSPEIEIPLDPRLSAAENADRHFRRARKGKRAIEALGGRLDEVRAQRDSIERAVEALDAADDDTAVDAARDALSALGLSLEVAEPRTKKRTRKKARTQKGIRRYRSRQGLEILAGRSARDNDRLSIHVARGNDLFFHRADRPGPHVILRVPPGKTASPESLEDAAFLAGYLGGWRGPAATMVHWTLAKYVRKPKGLPPGKVLVQRTREFLVKYRPELLERLVLDQVDGDT